MAQDKVTNLYNAFVKNGYAMESEAQFRENLKDPKKRRAAYDALVADGYSMEPFADFESNIGFGAPAPKPASQQQTNQATTAPTSSSAPVNPPTATAEEASATVQSAPEQSAWQPTEQEKIRMSYQLHTMLNDFNQRSKERIAQVQRMTEPFTAEGRKKRKAMKFQAQLAGTPTKVMGLTPPTTATPTDGAQGEAETAPQQQPIQSGQSPVPYGVKYVDGKPVTQWLLPDGSLTTDITEADRAEYGARTARLRHHFENRMKHNGLDPAKPEDVEMQAQYDAQAPAYDIVSDLWREAEEKHKQDKGRNAKKHWRGYAAMGGGHEMRIVTTGANRHDDDTSHMTRFDLQKMMDNAWERVGSTITSNCYNRLRQQYPGASEEELQASASQMARQLSDNAVYQYAVQQNTPKSTLEYFGRTVADMNVINSISKGLARIQAGTSGDLAAYEAAMGEYGKNHRVAQIAGTVTGMAVDPVTWVSGGVGSLAGKGAINIGGRIVASRAATSMSTQVGSRLFSSSLTGRIITGAAAGGGNFATYEMLKEGESQFLHGGHINPETGENEGYSAGAVLSAGGHGLILGSVTGTLSPVIGNVADKTVKATTSTGVKAGVRFGEVAVSTLAEGTIFALPEWYDNSKRSDSDPNKRDNFDIWTDNMAMMLGFKAQHGLKSAPRVIASLRPVKPVNGRPLTQAERNHNRMDFEERLRRNLDASPSDLSFTADEREELRRAGYGELSDLFSRDRVQEVRRPDIDPAEGAVELRAERVEAETINQNPEFDGYSSMEELMQDGRVSQSARAKAYYILTGRRLPMASVTGYTTNTDADGRVTVNSIAANGEVVTSRTFKNEQEAKQETDNIMRQAELNSVDVGERYKEAVADDMVLDAAISEVAPGADPATIKNIYRAVKAGNKEVTESQRQLVDFLDDAIERNRDIADNQRPEAIREALKEETGIDVDAVLRKMPGKRTEAERAVVKLYLERLFPEETRQRAAEPTPEQAEAQSQYEQGRELFGRFEEGDPTVQADVDAIALRMQEAYQAVEDVFGAEAEYYMFHVNENPWALVDDPELTVEQKDAVLYYINAKAALDGVMDASNEVADRKRAEVEESVAKRTHKDNGVIIPATMKVDDRQVYIVKGDVVMFPDGSAVDVRNSSESVVVMDAQTGEYEFTSPDQIFKVSDSVNPQDELDTALSVIEQEQMNVFGDNAVVPEEPAPATESEAPSQPIVDTSEYGRGYEQGLFEAENSDDAWIDNFIKIYSQNTPESMSEDKKGRLDAYRYEQQRRAMDVSAEEAVLSEGDSLTLPTDNNTDDGYGNGPQQDNDTATWSEGEDSVRPVASDAAGSVASNRDRSTIRSYEEGLANRHYDHSDDSERNRRDAESERLVGIAKANGQYFDRERKTSLGIRNPKGTGESEVYRDFSTHKIYKVKDPYAKSPMKGDVQPEDVIYEHLVHNKYFPETAYGFEGISDDMGDVRIVLSQDYVESVGQPTKEQIESALAEKGLLPEGRYTYGNEEISVTDVTGDNALLGADGKVYFIDPIINFKKPVREILGETEESPQEEVTALQRIPRDSEGKPDYEAADTETAWDALVESAKGNEERAKRVADGMVKQKRAELERVKKLSAPNPGKGKYLSPEELLEWEESHDAMAEAAESALAKWIAIARAQQDRQAAADNRAAEERQRKAAELWEKQKEQQRQEEAARKSAEAEAEARRAELVAQQELAEREAAERRDSNAGRVESAFDDYMQQLRDEAVSRHITPEQRKQMEREDRAQGPAQYAAVYSNWESPQSLEEYIARVLSTNDKRVKWSGTGNLAGELYGQEKMGERKEHSWMTSDKNGISFAKFVHDIWEGLIGDNGLAFNNRVYTDQDVRNAVIDALRSNPTSRGLYEQALNMHRDNGMDGHELRSELEELAMHEDEIRDEWYKEHFHISAEEYEAAEVQMLESISESGITDEDIRMMASETIDEYINSNYYGTERNQGSNQVLPAAQADDTIGGEESVGGRPEASGGTGIDDDAAVNERLTKEEASAQVNAEPTEAQKAAGNYKMGHRRVDGYNISIENAKGSVRRGTGADGKPWETTMQNDYGYIRGTEGVDGDHIDVFLSDTPEQGDVFVVDQVNEDGSFDEHKVMYGFPTEQAARDAYLSNYEPGWTGLGAITHVSKDEFKKWIQSSRRKTKPFAEYKSVKAITEDVDQTRTNVNAEGMVVDGEGNPITLYHGTPNDVEALSDLEAGHPRKGEGEPARFNGDGVSFTPHRDVAEDYASLGDGNKGKVFEANIILKNPYYTVGVANFTPEEAAEFTASLKAKGHDGIINYASQSMRQMGTEPNEVIVFDIKSAVPAVTEQADTDVVYSITPTTYTNKKGKTSDVHLVKFNRELTAEEKAALDTFAREPLTEGKKTSRGWYDRKQGGYMMRSEEAARQLAEMIGNEEAVADAQPMTAEELREAVAPAAPAEKKPARKPKKAPINRVSLEDVMTDLSTKGETKLSDHAEPVKAEPEQQHEISDDEMQSLADELRDLLGIGDDEGDTNIKFRDPGELTPQERQRIQSAGIRLAMGLIERGTTAFPDYATKMVGLLGDKIRPWLKSFYEGARWTPGYDKYTFTPTEQVATFDVQNFDKKQADPIAQAAMIVEERKASTASAQAQKELTETRNKNRRENDKQTEADTAALAEKAEAVAGEAEVTAQSAGTGEAGRKRILRDLKRVDDTLDEVNDQLAILGYYEAEEVDKDFNEAYGYMRNAEKKAVKDAVDLAKQLVNDLGLGLDKVTGSTTANRGKRKNAVTANIAPAGGDISIRLPLNEGRELYITIGLDPSVTPGDVTYSGDNLQATRIMYRVEWPDEKGHVSFDRMGRNCWADTNVTYADLLNGIQREAKEYLPSSTPAEEPAKSEPQEEAYHGSVTLKDGREAVVIAANHVQNIGEPSRLTDYIVGVKGEPGTIKISPDEIAHAGAPTAEDNPSTPAKAEETHNGYKIGDEVMWDRYGNGKWEKQRIADFDKDGRPILDSFGQNWITEIADWERIKPADGIFGEAQRVARAEQEKKATADAVAVLTGNKSKKSRKKDVTLKPEQPIGDLFGGLFDNPQNSSNHEEAEMGTRPGEAGGQRQQLKQDTQVGGDEPRRETERPAGEAGGGSTGMDSDADRAGGRGLHDVATQPALERLPEKERKNVHNNHVERGTEVAPKSESARIKANIAAIETMKKLEASGEAPTAADMKKLRAFSGWGGLGKAFSDWDTSRQLRQLLGDKLYDEGAEMSRNSAYFTPAYIVDAMWDIARAMGFKGGRVLEGSAGIGNVLGLMPQDLSERSYIRAVEKDPTTGKMLSLLYPDAVVDIDGFEKVKIETGTYDLVITNVPFVPGLKVADTSGDADISKEFKTSIHDFCIAKNVRKLRDGGVGVFITTAGSMDGTGRLYKWLANRENADIVGMFRMHNETFGGTNATSDIIVVRKRVNGVKSPLAIDCSLTTGVRTAEYNTGETKKVKNVGEVPIIKTLSMSYNRYYVEHPEYMAGEMHFGFEKGDTSFRPESKGLYPVKEKDQSQLLSQWVEDMKRNLADTAEETALTVMNHRDEYVPTYDKVGNEVKTGTIVVDSQGRICVNYDGTARPLMSKLDNKSPKSADERIAQFNKNKVKGRTRAQVVQDYNAIKKALNDLLEFQKASDSDEGLQPKLKALNRAFDSFVATYGHLHGNNGLAWLKNDVDYPSVIALETYREEGLEHKKVFGKADIFSRRVVVRPEQPKATNVRDGVTLSIRQTGSLDTRYIAEQLGMNEADVRREVIEAGLGYENPLTHSMEAAHEYLSGNVREKMQQAEANNEDGRYTPNITALRKVVPHSIPSHFIEFSIGSSWLRPELFEQYVKERTGASVKLTYAGGMWAMDKPRWTGEQDKSFGIRSEICDKVITGTELIEAAMTNRTIRVSKQQKDGPTISDPKATSACAAKVDEIRDDFKSWLRSRMEADPELAKEIEERYNDIFNNSAPMTIPDEYIPEYFDGAARVIGGKPIKMRKHQAKAIVRGTMQSLMLAHEVGTGKTFTLITTAMEMRRLGTAKKPMIVVQNATLGQFVASAKALYPDARILSLEDRDRNAEGRKDFYAKIRYNDWDMVVIPQSVLERIPDHPDRERRFIEESIQEKMDVIEAMSKDREAGRAVAALKKDVENLRDQLNKLSDTETADDEVMERVMATPGSKPKKDGKRAAIAKENAKTRAEEMLNRATDDTLNFDDLGVDAILVDEAHEYKHLGFATAMQRGVKGVDPSYSKKCQGLYLKVKAVQEKSGGRNVIFATGTPISNTAAEVWTFMRYLLPREVMEGHNIWHFDDFVRNFGSIQQMLEFTTQGTYKENNRFAGYSNLPELARIWAGITDTVLTAEAGEVKSQIPELEGGQPADLYLPQTNGLRAVLKFGRAQLKAYDEMSGQEKKENSHIPLVMYGIAKAAAIDARLVMANAPDDPHSKTNEAVRQTLRSLEDSKAYNGTVAIFADNYQRKNKETGAVEFNLFDDIRTKLIAQGVPAEKVVIMRDGMTDKAKEKIFAKVNAGEIRVILGTTQRLGVGVNIQERLHTLMHIDAPNRPMDYWQRMGRLLRQGNMHKEMGIPVRVIRFGVEDSLDVTAYQRLKTKGAIADAIMHSKDLLANNLENRILEEEGDEFGNITAELSGSQYAMLQNQTEKELRKLQAKQDQHRQHQMYIHRAEPRLRELIEKFGNDIARSDEILALLENNPTTITINGKTYENRDDMQKVFEAHNKSMASKKQSVQQNEPITSTLTFDIGNVHFTMTTHVSQMAGYGGQGTLAFDVQVQHDVVSDDIDYKRSYGDIPLKRIINELVDNVTSGKEERSNREAWVNAKERNETDLATLLKDKGKPFEHGGRIKELEQKLEEYTLAMQEELKEKEAKYAEMDANIEDATDITFTSEDDEDSTDTPTTGDGNKYRDGTEMSDGERLRAIRALAPIPVARNELSREELREVYNNLPVVEKDGREIEFYRSAFKKIYKKEGLFGQVVPVLDEVLEKSVLAYSEGDNLGGTVRPDGTVHRVHPNVDSFDNYVGKVSINGKEYYVRTTVQTQEGQSGPHSVFVTEVSIYENTASSLSYPGTPRARVTTDGIVDTKLQQFFERASSEANILDMRDRVNELSERSGINVRVITDESELAEMSDDGKPRYSRRERRAKGWWSAKDDEVVIVLPNNVNVADVDNTFVHEVVGHKGLRALVGEERFNEFLGEIYDHASNPIRKVIDKMTDKMVSEEADRLRVRKAQAHERAGEDVNANYFPDMAKARVEAEKKREEFRKEATEEYMSDLGGRIGSEGFEKMSRDELTLWGTIKAKVQKFLDMFLRGLKIAKSIRLTDKDLSYILFKSWKNMREKGVFADAEDVVMRRRTGYDADDVTRFRDPGLGLEETITKMKAEAMQANAGNLQAKRDAMRAIGGNLNHLRQAMARQREYDITTAKSIKDLARILMENGLLDSLGNAEVKSLLAQVTNSIGRQDISKQVDRVFEIMVNNHLRNTEQAFGKLISMRTSRVDGRGIQVQGDLDPDGQAILRVFNNWKGLTVEEIDRRITDAIDSMSDSHAPIAERATLEYAGLQMAREYAENIASSKTAEKELREEIKKAKEEKDAGRMTADAYRQSEDATRATIQQMKLDRIAAYESLTEKLGGELRESVERAKQWRDAEKERVNAIHHYANSDMQGRELRGDREDTRLMKLRNHWSMSWLLEPMSTLDQMLKMFGSKNPNGEGYLYNHFMRGWADSADREQEMKELVHHQMDDKAAKIFGKHRVWYNGGVKKVEYTYSDIYGYAEALPGATITYYDGAEMREYEVGQGTLLYLYAVDKMPMGRATNRRMGIEESTMQVISDALDPKLKEYADWVQEELLPQMGDRANEVHKKMFGASMDAIENYFPFVRDKNALKRDVENGQTSQSNDRISVQTGAIKKRVPSVSKWNMRQCNFMDVLAKHVDEMCHWTAFAELNRDFGTLLSYNRLKQQVFAMTSVYGAGQQLWKRFEECCAIATDAYDPQRAKFDRFMVQGAKGVTMGKISLRTFTALKQTLSLPAFFGEVDMRYVAADLATGGVKACKWAWANMPNFRKRILSRTSGDYRLKENEYDGKIMKASSYGMLPNIGVDAWTIAVGSHGVYKTRKAKYLRWGMEESQAERRAIQDAELCYNKSQQSSEGPFMAPVQVDHTFYATSAMLFRNSSTSYTREAHTSARNLKRIISGEVNEDFVAKQILRTLHPEAEGAWTDDEWDYARKNAKREIRSATIKNTVNLAMFGWILPWLWRIGGVAPLLLLSGDDEEKDKQWNDTTRQSMFAPIEGLAYGDVIEDGLNMLTGANEKSIYNLGRSNPILSDIMQAAKKADKDQMAAANDVINILVGMGTGINPQTITDWAAAIIDYNSDAQTQHECALLVARLLSCPQSQLEKVYFEELDMDALEASQLTPDQLAERYAEYKMFREAPLTGWLRSEEASDSIKAKRKKKVLDKAEERFEGHIATERTKQLLADYDAVEKQLTEANKLRKTDKAAYREERKRILGSADMRVHGRVKRYKRDISQLTERYRKAKSNEERDSIVSLIFTTRERLLNDLDSMQQ